MKNLSKYYFVGVCFIALGLYPLVASTYSLDLVSKIMIYAILALSLELLVGRTGIICFGQAAFFGIGAYSVVILSPETEAMSLLWALPTAIVLAALYALFVGALSLRTQGVYFIMVTLAFAQMAYYVVHDTDIGGGTDGAYLYFRPEITGLDLNESLDLYILVLICLFIVFTLLAVICKSHFGRALSGIHANEQRMRATGFSTYPYKLCAFVISGGIAGLSGFLFAVKDGFVNPEMLSWHLSGAVLVMIILGGLGHLRGALIGAFAFTLLEEFFKSDAIFHGFSKHWHLGLGLTIILSVALLPNGLVGIPRQLRDRMLGGLGNRDEEDSL